MSSEAQAVEGAETGARSAGKLTQLLPTDLLQSGYHRYSKWAHQIHGVATVGAVAADFLHPLGHWALYVFLAMVVIAAGALAAAWWRKIAPELAVATLLFCLVLAALFGALHVAETMFGDKHGILAKLLPALQDVQQKLNIVSADVKEIRKGVTEIRESQVKQESRLEEITTLSREMKEALKEISDRKGVPIPALLKILQRVGETRIADDPGEIEKKLNEKADEYLALRRQLALLASDDPQVAALRKEAEAAIANSDFDRAQGKLRDAAQIDHAAVKELAARAQARAIGAVESLKESARLSRLTLSYHDAARDLAHAAELLAPYDRTEAMWLHVEQAAALHIQGDEFGDNPALAHAIDVLRNTLKLVSRKDEAEQWATIQDRLGMTLRTLGEREGGTALLEEAIAAHREALQEYKRERVPLAWALTQNNLGSALQDLGKLERSIARLEEAVAAFDEALKEFTRERAPLDWAMTQNNRAVVLKTLDEREGGTGRLEEAVAALRLVLTVYTRERVPLSWAATQSNLGTALAVLGAHESGTARLDEAVAAYREALKEYTRERAPLDWARTQSNLGRALEVLGARESGTARLHEALAAYTEALKERTLERVPLQWAAIQNDLGSVLRLIGAREGSSALLDRAVAAYQEALKERTRERLPFDWAVTQRDLGDALVIWADLEDGTARTARLDAAVAAYRKALKELTREREPLQWAEIQSNLADALQRLGARESGNALLNEAVTLYREALKEGTQERSPLQWATTKQRLGDTLQILGLRQNSPVLLEEALATYRESLDAARRFAAIDGGSLQWRQQLRFSVNALGNFSYRLLLAGAFAQALAAADQAISSGSDMAWLHMHRAHALMFLGRLDEARALYLRRRGETNVQEGKSWEAAVMSDFAELRAAALTHQLMDEIEKRFAAGG